MPNLIEGSVLIMSNYLLSAYLCVQVQVTYIHMVAGLFMAKQEKLISCGTSLTVIAIVFKFFAGPAAMAISCIAVGLHGDVLHGDVLRVAAMAISCPARDR